LGVWSSLTASHLVAFQRAADDLRQAAASFDATLASGTDTSNATAMFVAARTDLELAASRLATDLDASGAGVAQAWPAVASAQAQLNTATARAVPVYEAWRVTLTQILGALTNEGPLAASAKTTLARTTTFVDAMNAAVTGGLAGAAAAIDAAARQAAAADTQRGSVSATAAQQSASAWAQLSMAQANAAVGPGTLTWLP